MRIPIKAFSSQSFFTSFPIYFFIYFIVISFIHWWPLGIFLLESSSWGCPLLQHNFSSFIHEKLKRKNFICVRYTTWCFEIYIYISTHTLTITIIKLNNIAISSHSYYLLLFPFVCVCMCMVWTPAIYPLSKFQVHSTLWITIVTFLYIPQNLFCITEILYLWPMKLWECLGSEMDKTAILLGICFPSAINYVLWVRISQSSCYKIKPRSSQTFILVN